VPNQKEGESIASYLVENHLAACVNIIPKLTSIYEWKGKIQKDSELLLIIKTNTLKEQQVYDNIKIMHTYETPEIITVDINNIDNEYSEWLNSVVNITENGKNKD
jgi:periplasmic divalent cation tolerance protein